MKTKAIRKLLIIDDDEGVFSSVDNTVAVHFGECISTSYSQSIATGFTQFFAQSPDLVLLDIHFGTDNSKTEGIELLKRIKQIPMPRFVPFVLLSDRLSINKELAGLEERYLPDDFISKPLHQGELIAKIMQWERTLYAERKLATQTTQLAKKAQDLAGKHVSTMKHLGEQHSVAALGLFTRGLLSLFSDTILSVRGYASIMQSNMAKGIYNKAQCEKAIAEILRITEPPKAVISALQNHFDASVNEATTDDVNPILDGLLFLSKQELAKKGVEVIQKLTPVEKCVFVPGYFVQTVISLLLFYRDASVLGSILDVSSRQSGNSVWVSFACPVLKEHREQANRLVSSDAPQKKDRAESLFAAGYSLQSAIEAAARMQGNIDIKIVGESLAATIFLSVKEKEYRLIDT